MTNIIMVALLYVCLVINSTRVLAAVTVHSGFLSHGPKIMFLKRNETLKGQLGHYFRTDTDKKKKSIYMINLTSSGLPVVRLYCDAAAI